MFMGVGLVSISTGHGVAYPDMFLREPYSKTLAAVINKTMKEDEKFLAEIKSKIEVEVFQARKGKETPAALGEAEKESKEDVVAEIEGAKRDDPIERKFKAEKQKLFDNVMEGWSYMNIFHFDNTRALSNLPRPDASPRSTLLTWAVGNDSPPTAPTSSCPPSRSWTDSTWR